MPRSYRVENKYQVPTSTPDSAVCLQIPVPDDPAHWSNLWGALKTLCSPSQYADNGLWSDIVAASDRWTEIVSALTPSGDSCELPIQFQRNVDNPVQWDYSLDGGITWLTGPDTWRYFYPDFVTSLGTPSGWQLSVNQGNQFEPVPVMSAVAGSDIVRTDPASDAVNTIAPSSGIIPIELQAQLVSAVIMHGTRTILQLAKTYGTDPEGVDQVMMSLEKAADDIAPVLITVLTS